LRSDLKLSSGIWSPCLRASHHMFLSVLAFPGAGLGERLAGAGAILILRPGARVRRVSLYLMNATILLIAIGFALHGMVLPARQARFQYPAYLSRAVVPNRTVRADAVAILLPTRGLSGGGADLAAAHLYTRPTYHISTFRARSRHHGWWACPIFLVAVFPSPEDEKEMVFGGRPYRLPEPASFFGAASPRCGDPGPGARWLSIKSAEGPPPPRPVVPAAPFTRTTVEKHPRQSAIPALTFFRQGSTLQEPSGTGGSMACGPRTVNNMSVVEGTYHDQWVYACGRPGWAGRCDAFDFTVLPVDHEAGIAIR